MRRRQFLGVLSGAATWPIVVRAQQHGPGRRIGVMLGLAENNEQGRRWLSTFEQELVPLGWIDQRNVMFEVRWTGGDAAKIAAYATELVLSKPDVILAQGTATISALQRETRSIPIVGVQVVDPVASGFVKSLASPGGNITGFTNFEDTIGGKWLATLKEVAPNISQAATLTSSSNIAHPRLTRTIEVAAGYLGVQARTLVVRSAADIEPLLREYARHPNGGLIVLPDTVTATNALQIVNFAAQYRLPAIYPFRHFVSVGGLVSYGSDQSDFFRRAASYVDRILRGANPADLPVQAPTKFELVINQKTAKSLGLTVPPMLLTRADEVIE